MQYAVSVPFRGDTDKAFSLAESALTAIGFRLTQRTAGSSVELAGPGMDDFWQSPLVGASRIHIASRSGELALEADLNGVVRKSRFVMFFPPGLCLFMGIVVSVVSGTLLEPGLWLGGLAVLCSLLGPWMARSLRARTCLGLDTLLANMVVVGESAERPWRSAGERG